MRQHQTTDDITDGKDMPYRGAATIVRLDHAVFRSDAGLIQLQRLQRGTLAGGHNHVVATEVVLLTIAAFVGQFHLTRLAGNLGNFGGGFNRQTRILVEHSGELFGDLRLDLGQNAFLTFKQLHCRTEVLEDLRHFHTDGAATDHAQTFGRGLESPDRIRGQYATAFQPIECAGDRRHEGRRASGDHRDTETET